MFAPLLWPASVILAGDHSEAGCDFLQELERRDNVLGAQD